MRNLKSEIINWALPALMMLLGLQLLRVVVPLWLYVLRDRIGWSAIQVGELALGMFALSFLTGWVNRTLGTRRAVLATGGGLVLSRLFFQLWLGDPLVNMIVAMAGVVCWLWLWPILIGWWRKSALSAVVLGMLLGVALDLALHGVYGTYDMAWRSDGVTAVIVMLLVALFAWLLWLASQPMTTTSDPRGSVALLWLVFGPYLFLQFVVFNNLAGVTAVTGWSSPAAFGWMLLGHVLGIGAAIIVLQTRPRWSLWFVLPMVLLALFIFDWDTPAYAWRWLVGQLFVAVWLALIIPALAADTGRDGLRRLTIWHGVGMLLMTIFLFLFYSGYDIRLPLQNTSLPPTAALIIGLLAVWVVWRPVTTPTADKQPLVLFVVAAFLLLLPLGSYAVRQSPQPVSGTGYPVKVMTYNLHNGFNPQGDLDMEALAQVIEAENPDIVALQEVSRGWVVNGSLDMADWLGQRLEMPYLYAPTTDPMWGMAVLSRYPIVSSEFLALPPDDLLLKRGVLWTAVDVGADQPLNVLSTHYHHIEADSAIRVQQSTVVLANLPAGPTVLLGDLNARPTDPEMTLLQAAGFVEVLDFEGNTYPANEPDRRIDYIWLSGELTAVTATIPQTPASDHLGIVAVIELVE